ncbi:unnamed protein product [Caenorhabditis auriculariae]|uniref:Rad50/SbcC-type AAA domain-containing protein n=1 Tax=Caenorhabditis auriculariae TaxID=2777116 RepID=A0A8S1GWB0_9PELO|nr:unnamed protein product [Caenorhabditis auriculariae]
MARLLKLKVQGLRSVGHKTKDSLEIPFVHPLTIINGSIGTGKTTIIESLNSIATGAWPCGNLQNFIRYPETGKPTIEVSISLEFEDLNGCVCTSTKRMVATLMKGKLRCKSETLSLKIRMPNGQERKVSKKLLKVQREIIEHMGAPAVILDHVNFCHQDEHFWPLGEELKVVLDQVFQSSNFTRAIEKMEEAKQCFDQDLALLTEKQRKAESQLGTKTELQGDPESLQKFVNAEKAYKIICNECHIMNESAKNLQKYTKTLASSLIAIHSEKMAEINEIIDDLWRKVSKGLYIDSIRIGSKCVKTSSGDKSYSYSVLMTRGSIETEMRGNESSPSLGEKSLACLVIRIALAAVFGGARPIIALDEPTRDMDKTRSKLVAAMLNDLIVSRGVQVIIVTNDDRLLKKLVVANRPDFTFVLEKDQRGLSSIRSQLLDR